MEVPLETLMNILSIAFCIFGFLPILFAVIVHLANNAKGIGKTIYHWPTLLGGASISTILFTIAYLLFV